MAMKKTAKKTNRGSPEAIAKRRVARVLNQLFSENGQAQALDGRTLKRKLRLTQELKEGKGGKPLKALEVLGHVTELLALGETLPSIRALKPMLPPTPKLQNGTATLLAEVQSLYGFEPRAWRVLGVDIEKIGDPAKAEELPTTRTRRSAKKKATTSRSRARSATAE